MFNELGYNSNLEELVNANKADESIAYIIKENIDIQENARKFINITEKEIEELNVTGEGKKSIKMQIPIYNVKDYLSILGEIRSIKKQLKQKTEEVETYNEEIRKAEEQNSEIEKEIEGQYKIYVENEIFTKAVEKMDKSKIDVTSDFYKSYLKHIDDYKNSIYSIEKNSKLPEPKAEDLVAVLNVLKQSENEKKSTEKNTTKKKTVKADNANKVVEEKKTTRKKSTKTNDTEGVVEEKKTTRKKSTKTNDTEGVVEEKKTTRKRATKTDNTEGVVEEKKTTRKKATKADNTDGAVEEKKTTRKRATKADNTNEVVEEKKTTRKKATKTESDNSNVDVNKVTEA